MSTSTENEKTMQWFYLKDDQTIGPVSTEDLHGLFQSGGVTASTYVFCEGMSDWTVAREALPDAIHQCATSLNDRHRVRPKVVLMAVFAICIPVAVVALLWIFSSNIATLGTAPPTGLDLSATAHPLNSSAVSVPPEPANGKATSFERVTEVPQQTSASPIRSNDREELAANRHSFARVSPLLVKVGFSSVGASGRGSTVFQTGERTKFPVVEVFKQDDTIERITASAFALDILEVGKDYAGDQAKEHVLTTTKLYMQWLKSVTDAVEAIARDESAGKMVEEVARKPFDADLNTPFSMDRLFRTNFVVKQWNVRVVARFVGVWVELKPIPDLK